MLRRHAPAICPPRRRQLQKIDNFPHDSCGIYLRPAHATFLYTVRYLAYRGVVLGLHLLQRRQTMVGAGGQFLQVSGRVGALIRTVYELHASTP